jgi:hypothetical protein
MLDLIAAGVANADTAKSWHMCKDPDGEVALFRDQTLTHTAFPCVFLDVT